MNKVIVINNGDGTCAVVVPCPDMFDPNSKTRGLLASNGIVFNSDEEVLQFIINKDVPEGKEYRITDVSNLPQDRTFRNAWTDDNPTETVDVDVEKAKEIKKDHLRELRKPLLEKLDIAYQRADESSDSDKKAEIAAQKQALRDVTSVELPDDVDQLKAFVPDILLP